jgi:hypothetical protein
LSDLVSESHEIWEKRHFSLDLIFLIHKTGVTILAQATPKVVVFLQRIHKIVSVKCSKSFINAGNWCNFSSFCFYCLCNILARCDLAVQEPGLFTGISCILSPRLDGVGGDRDCVLCLLCLPNTQHWCGTLCRYWVNV